MILLWMHSNKSIIIIDEYCYYSNIVNSFKIFIEHIFNSLFLIFLTTYYKKYFKMSKLLSPFVMVPQQHVMLIERFGKFVRTLEPGFQFKIPLAELVAFHHSLKE